MHAQVFQSRVCFDLLVKIKAQVRLSLQDFKALVLKHASSSYQFAYTKKKKNTKHRNKNSSPSITITMPELKDKYTTIHVAWKQWDHR